MKIVIQTQYMENYGAHDWDGEGQCPQYWKAKGGMTYVIQDLSEDQAFNMQEYHMPKIYSLIEYNNDYSQNYVVSAQTLEDNAVVTEPWDTPEVISVKDGVYTSSVVVKNDEYCFMNKLIEEKRESYVMLEEGQRKEYCLEFLLKDGQVVGNEKLINLLK